MTALEMAERVQDYLDKEEVKYEYKHDEEKPSIATGFTVKCKFNSIKMFISFGVDGYSVLGVVPLCADEETRAEVAKYITMANYGLRNGNFEMDFRDGEVRYKVFVPAKHLNELPDETICDSIFIIPSMIQRYGNGLAAIMMGFSDAETEVVKAENMGM